MEELQKQPNRIDILELDIDTRMAALWAEAFETTEWDLEKVGAFMRAAYGKGYCDALTELPEDRGTLTRDHGYAVPSPRPLPVDPL